MHARSVRTAGWRPSRVPFLSNVLMSDEQETDRGRHDKKTLKERSLYSVDSDPEHTMASCPTPS